MAQQVLRWLVEAAMAIEHMHEHNAVHRDIKPSNLFLNRWGDIKLGDFGLSTVLSSRQTKNYLPVGTLGYLKSQDLVPHRVI